MHSQSVGSQTLIDFPLESLNPAVQTIPQPASPPALRHTLPFPSATTSPFHIHVTTSPSSRTFIRALADSSALAHSSPITRVPQQGSMCTREPQRGSPLRCAAVTRGHSAACKRGRCVRGAVVRARASERESAAGRYVRANTVICIPILAVRVSDRHQLHRAL